MNENERLARAHAAFVHSNFGEALALLLPAESAYVRNESALALIVNAAQQCRRNADAIRALDHLVALRPENPQYRRMLSQAINRDGSAASQSGDDVEAERHFKRAMAVWPDNADAIFNLADTYDRNRLFAQALPLWQTLRVRLPDDHQVALALANCLGSLDRVDDARAAFPDIGTDGTASLRLRGAEVAARLGLIDVATRALADLTPTAGDAMRLFALGDYLAGASEMPLARTAYDLAARVLDQGNPSPGVRARIASALALPAIYRDHADIDSHRQRYSERLAQLERELVPLAVDSLQPSLSQLAWSNFYLAYQGCNDRDLQIRYGRLLAGLAAAFTPRSASADAGSDTPARANADTTRAPIRIALVGSIFRHCTAGSYFGRWATLLPGLGYHVDIFQLGPGFDAFTDELAKACRHLHRIESDLDSLADRLREANFDLLIYPELGMDARLLPLAALRLGRRQACAWGHPVTTGLPTIDAYFSCATMEPADHVNHYSEPVLLLPGLGTDYLRPEAPAAASRIALGLPDDRRLYLLPQSLFKMHPDNDAVMTAVAQHDPDALLVLFRGEGGAAFAPYRRRIDAAFRSAGLDPDRHLLFLSMGTRERFLQINRQCDVMVDTLHWSGGNTSLDALVSGLPIVTCPGEFMRSRQSAAMLGMMGLDELIVESPDRLAQAAVAIACNPVYRRDLNRRIDAALPALFDTGGLAEAMRTHIEHLVAA